MVRYLEPLGYTIGVLSTTAMKPVTRQPISDATVPMLTVATYRGIADGWVPVGGPRTPDDAMRLLLIVERIRNNHNSALVR